MRPSTRTRALLTAALLVPVGLVGTPTTAGATVIDFAPTQADCDSGSVTPLWSQTGITIRPTIIAVTIDGESIAPSRITAPLDGEIGAAICAQDANFAQNSGLAFYKKVNSSTSRQNLTGAVTPGGRAITASSRIQATVSMGDLSPYFSFATVFGRVNNWTTAGIRSAASALTFDVSPISGVMVDGTDEFGNPSPSEQGCTQQPPNCDPLKADADTFGVYMQFKAERGPDTGFNSFAGGYFAVQSAVGGFVAARDGGLEVTIAGPHFKADGTTLNVGSMSAFLPESFLSQSFGLSVADVNDSTFAVTRSDGSGTSVAPWTYRAVPDGIAVEVASITFSSPTYRITKSSNSTTSQTFPPAANPKSAPPKQWPAPPFFHLAKRGRTVTAGFAAAPGGNYSVTYTNLLRTYHVTLSPTSTLLWKGRFVSKRLNRGTWLVISRQIVPGGYSLPSYQVISV